MTTDQIINDLRKQKLHEAATKMERMQLAIDSFCNKSSWAADTWKNQPHISELFKLWSANE